MAGLVTSNAALTKRSRRIHYLFAGGLLLIAAAMVETALGAMRYEDDAAWVLHTTSVRTSAARFLVDLQDVEDPVRGPHAIQLLNDEFARLRMFTSDNPRQQARLAEMVPLMKRPLHEQTALRQLAEQVRGEEISLQLTRKQRARSSLDHIYQTTAGSLLLALSLFAFAWWRLSRQLDAQQTALQQLRETEAQTTALLENGVDAVWAVDRELRVTARNRRFAAIAQAAGVLVDGKRDEVGLSLADHAAWREPYERALEGERITIEVSHELRGHVRHFMVSFGPILVDGKVTGVAAFAKDITTRKRAELKLQQRAETLHYLAVVDQLTHLYNRRGFLELGGALLRDARAASQTVTILFADLDGLKPLNDQLGHAAGDAAICAGGEALAESVRKSDLVARLGGDEFVVLAVGIEDETVLLERIEKKLADKKIRMSIGVAKDEPGDESRSLEQLMERADAAMYDEKMARKKRLAAQQTRARVG
ncbi:MAG TPA: diguanylate cyclase [Polyangia bacterium]|jgi:diguanylate cyclase (GGDEF)-like protein/PAS domain S-box-containing protein|nr:diguanylate cyclase [Polyangia bacterium]